MRLYHCQWPKVGHGQSSSRKQKLASDSHIDSGQYFIQLEEKLSHPKNSLRYYATFKVRKFESLFYKINTFFQKNCHLHQTAGRVNILCKYIICIFFSFEHSFCSSFSVLFSRASASCGKKKKEIIFAALYFCLHELKKCVSDFQNLISNWRYCFYTFRCLFQQIFSTKQLLFSRKQLVKSEIHFRREAIRN